MSNSDRPKVGPADPETRRKKLREALNEPTRAEGFKRSEKPAPAKPKKKRSTLAELLDPKSKRERTMEGENKALMEAVDEGVRQGTEEGKKRK